VQHAIVTQHNEIQQLKATSATLRDSLEAARIDKAGSINQAISGAGAEIAQLQGTIRVLREQLEALFAKSIN